MGGKASPLSPQKLPSYYINIGYAFLLHHHRHQPANDHIPGVFRFVRTGAQGNQPITILYGNITAEGGTAAEPLHILCKIRFLGKIEGNELIVAVLHRAADQLQRVIPFRRIEQHGGVLLIEFLAFVSG